MTPADDDRELGSRPPIERPLAVVMVGLPARGKSYTARKISQYLAWHGYRTHIFNLGTYRRDRFASAPATFFNPSNPEGVGMRDQLAAAAMDDLVAWVHGGGQVAVYDATNTTAARRGFVLERLDAAGIPALFVELRTSDPGLIEANIRETKLTSPDYAGVDPEEAARDFRARIAQYESVYEPLDSENESYIRISDVDEQMVINRVHGYVAMRIVHLLHNLHISGRTIWLSRHGESQDNVRQVLGGDASLTDRGREYAGALRSFVDSLPQPIQHVWTSTLRRAIETAEPLGRSFLPIRALDEIDTGTCDGLTEAEIAERHPAEYQLRCADKLTYRYPRGESYEDVIRRLDPVVLELERHRAPVLVVAHQAVLRCLYAYFAGIPRARCPYIEIPLHTVLELRPRAYGCEVERHELLPPLQPPAP